MTRLKARKIIVVRHAEKPATDSAPYGVTLKGKRSKESLTARGWQRAGALASLLAPANGRFQHPSLASPQFIYASKPLKRRGSQRPVETVTALAEKLAIDINSNFPRFDFENLLEEVFSCRGVVLICWQREYIPQLAAHILGKKTLAPKDWPEDRYDMIWVFDLNRSSTGYLFKQVPQRLLIGDQTTPL